MIGVSAAQSSLSDGKWDNDIIKVRVFCYARSLAFAGYAIVTVALASPRFLFLREGARVSSFKKNNSSNASMTNIEGVWGYHPSIIRRENGNICHPGKRAVSAVAYAGPIHECMIFRYGNVQNNTYELKCDRHFFNNNNKIDGFFSGQLLYRSVGQGGGLGLRLRVTVTFVCGSLSKKASHNTGTFTPDTHKI